MQRAALSAVGSTTPVSNYGLMGTGISTQYSYDATGNRTKERKGAAKRGQARIIPNYSKSLDDACPQRFHQQRLRVSCEQAAASSVFSPARLLQSSHQAKQGRLAQCAPAIV
jgi:hypothetical protein